MKKVLLKTIYYVSSLGFMLGMLFAVDFLSGFSQKYREGLLEQKEEFLLENLSSVYKEFQLYTRVVSFDERNNLNLVKTLNDLTNSSSNFSSFYYVKKNGQILARSNILTKKREKVGKSFSRSKWFSKLNEKSYSNDFQRGLANLVVGFDNSHESLAGYIYENNNETQVLVGYFSLSELLYSSFKSDWDFFRYDIVKVMPQNKLKFTAKVFNKSVLTDSPYFLVGRINYRSPVVLLFGLSLLVSLSLLCRLFYYGLHINRLFHDLTYDEMKIELKEIEQKFNNFSDYEKRIQALSEFILEKKDHINHLNSLMTNFESTSVEFCDETIEENKYCLEISERIVEQVLKMSQQIDKITYDFEKIHQYSDIQLEKLKQSIRVEILNTHLSEKRSTNTNFDEASVQNFSRHEELLSFFKNELSDKLETIKQNIDIVHSKKSGELASEILTKYKDSFNKLDEMLVSVHDVNVKISGQGRAYISELSRLVNEIGQLNFSEEEHGKLERLREQIASTQKALDFKKAG